MGEFGSEKVFVASECSTVVSVKIFAHRTAAASRSPAAEPRTATPKAVTARGAHVTINNKSRHALRHLVEPALQDVPATFQQGQLGPFVLLVRLSVGARAKIDGRDT